MTEETKPPPHQSVVDSISARLERLPNSRWQSKIRTLLGVVTFFEGFDQLLVSYTLPLIKTEWHLGAGALTLAVTAGSVGMLVGAPVGGGLADRFGRVRVVVAAMLVTAVASLLLMVSPNIEIFAILRFVQGLGIGAEVPVAAAFISELARAHGRGRFVLLYELAFPAGLTAAALVATAVVPVFGWRALYLIGALPALLAFAVRRSVPESPRWLAARGEYGRAEQAMEWVENRILTATKRPLPDPVATSPAPAIEAPSSRRGVLTLFERPYARRTAVVSALWFGGYFVNYGITAWLPAIYTSIYHVPLGTALTYTLYTSVVGFAGCVVVMLLVDRIGRRPSLVIGLIVGGALLVVLALLCARTGTDVAVWATLSGFFIFAVNICLYLYTAELYPARVRAMGVSFGGVWNRIGVILGPIVVGALIAAGASPATVFAVLGGVGIATGVVALFGEETTGRRLEDISS